MTQQLSTLSSNGELTDDELTQAVGEVLKEYPFSCELVWFLDSSSVEYEPTILALRSAIAADRQRRKLLMPVEGEVSMEQTSTVQPQVGYWLPIETAPRDGTAILAICKHDADPYTEDEESRLTAYGAWCEGGRHVSDGPNVIAWGGGYSLGGTDCPQETMPDWWFQVEGDTLGEAAACPVCWMPIPAYCPHRCPARALRDRTSGQGGEAVSITQKPFAPGDIWIDSDGQQWLCVNVHQTQIMLTEPTHCRHKRITTIYTPIIPKGWKRVLPLPVPPAGEVQP